MKPTKETATERLSNHIQELRARTKLDNWNAFITDLQVPSDLFPAMMTGRTQLMPKGRPLDASECQTLYTIIGVLMETNAALREHTEQTASLVSSWVDAFKGLHTVAQKIDMFANLRHTDEDETEDQAA